MHNSVWADIWTGVGEHGLHGRYTGDREPKPSFNKKVKKEERLSKITPALQICRLNALSTLNVLYKTPLPWQPCSSKKKGTESAIRKRRELCTPQASRPDRAFFLLRSPLSKQNKLAGRVAVHGAPGPAVGRHGGRAAPGLRPRQAPQVRLLLPLVVLLLGARSLGRPAGARGGGAAAACRDTEHHHAAARGAVRRHVAAQRVQLRAVVARQRRPGLALRRSHDAQGRGLEEAAPEGQDGRRRRCPRHAEEPHRLRLGGDQLAGPVK